MESLAYRLVRRMRRDLRALMLKAHDCFISTSCDPVVRADKVDRLFSFVDAQFIERLGSEFPDYPELVRSQAENSMAHRFDLLGSGPVVVKHGMRCQGLNGFSYAMSPTISRDQFGDWLGRGINRSNRSVAKEIWRRVDEGYVPIDWQIDFKSGFRWSERTWYRDVSFGKLPGVDVKVPWELSRMQHLPTLALASCFASAGFDGFEAPDRYAREFRNQILDFIVTNPPRFGVNWACAMDVAIRVANWLVAYDLIAASGIRFDDEFEGLFVASVKAHARHISANLEWSPTVRGNHYIANIVGLLFSSIYLPCDKETNTWLAFSISELISEVDYQFHEDGSNFEGSVCYHRLSAEMVTWASALIRNLAPQKRVVLSGPVRWTPHLSPQLKSRAIEFYKIPGAQRDSPLPEWFWERLAKMATFTNAMIKPDGLIVQFGDNDSGRFIVLGSGELLRAENDPSSPLWSLDHRSLIACIRAVVGYEIGTTRGIIDPAAFLLSAICGNTGSDHIKIRSLSALEKNYESNANEAVWLELIDRFVKTPTISRFKSTYKADVPGLLDEIEYDAFPGMGVYVMRSPRFYVAVRCGEIGLAGLGGHTHCDQLTIELVIDGITRIRDPGTLTYTPLPDQRNTYRSAMAHHVPRVQGLELADLTRGVFDLRDCAEGQCLYFGPRGFIGRHYGYGEAIYRIVELYQDSIQVCDFAEAGLPISDPTPLPLPYSHGYGQVTAS